MSNFTTYTKYRSDKQESEIKTPKYVKVTVMYALEYLYEDEKFPGELGECFSFNETNMVSKQVVIRAVDKFPPYEEALNYLLTPGITVENGKD